MALLAGPLMVVLLNRVDWGFLPDESGPLSLSVDLLAWEAVASYRLTLAALLSFLVFRAFARPSRPGRAVAAQLPVYLWGLEAVRYEQVILEASGEWGVGWILLSIWMPGIVTLAVLVVVLLAAVLHVAERDSSRPGKRRVIAKLGIAPVLSMGVVVVTVLMDWLLVSLVLCQSILEKVSS